jgi:hypothetical protein
MPKGRPIGSVDLKLRKNARDPNAPKRRPRQSFMGKAGEDAPKLQRATPSPKASPAQRRAQAQADSHGSNGVNGEAATKLIKALLASHEERLSIMGSAMNGCRVTRQADKELISAAKAEGQPVRAINAEVNRIILERKVAAIRDNLEPDDQEMLDQVRAVTPDVVRAALGSFSDSPLGRAAVSDAERRAKAIGSLAGGPDAPSTEAAPTLADLIQRNADAIESGIKPLN